MRYSIITMTLGCVCLAASNFASADSIWERRDPKNAYLFHDYRARQVGDILTIVVNENTEFDASEAHTMGKTTSANASATGSGKAAAGSALSRSFSGSLAAGNASDRQFDSKANQTIGRKLADQMSVIVVDVAPNGNLILEGYRQRVINNEVRLLRVTGIVRPGDVGPFNTVQSRYIANFSLNYKGRGPDTNFTNQGWGARLTNVLWPW